MKKRAIVIYILAFALTLSACGYVPQENTEGSSDPSLQESESTQPTEETAPPQPTYYYGEWADIEELIYTEDDVVFTENGIIAGPFTFEYVDATIDPIGSLAEIKLNGLNLISCQVDTAEVVIPSVVCNIPVVAIAYAVIGQSWKDEPNFIQNTALEYLYIPDSVLWIDEGAFYGCPELKEVRLSHSLTFLGPSGSDNGETMFDETLITFIDVPEGVTSLGYDTFNASGIQSLILPSTLSVICTCSLTNAYLSEIYLRAEEAHYPESLLEEIGEQTDATLYFYSETEPTEEGNFWRYVDGKPAIW